MRAVLQLRTSRQPVENSIDSCLLALQFIDEPRGHQLGMDQFAGTLLDQLRALHTDKSGSYKQYDDRREANRQDPQNLLIGDRFGIHVIFSIAQPGPAVNPAKKLCGIANSWLCSERSGFQRDVTMKPMEVHFTPEQEAQLAQIATNAGTDAERLVKDAALRLLEEDARFRAAVREGIAQADRSEFIEEAEMDARLEQMLRS